QANSSVREFRKGRTSVTVLARGLTGDAIKGSDSGPRRPGWAAWLIASASISQNVWRQNETRKAASVSEEFCNPVIALRNSLHIRGHVARAKREQNVTGMMRCVATRPHPLNAREDWGLAVFALQLNGNA